MGNALLQPWVAPTELKVAFLGGLVQLRGDAVLVKLKAVLGEDAEKAFKLRNGMEQPFEFWQRNIVNLAILHRLNGIRVSVTLSVNIFHKPKVARPGYKKVQLVEDFEKGARSGLHFL